MRALHAKVFEAKAGELFDGAIEGYHRRAVRPHFSGPVFDVVAERFQRLEISLVSLWQFFCYLPLDLLLLAGLVAVGAGAQIILNGSGRGEKKHPKFARQEQEQKRGANLEGEKDH